MKREETQKKKENGNCSVIIKNLNYSGKRKQNFEEKGLNNREDSYNYLRKKSITRKNACKSILAFIAGGN